MRNLFVTAIVLSTFILVSCSKKNNDDLNCKCAYMVYIPQDSVRSTSKSVKGQILFSWKNGRNNWNYSIVSNLNIRAAHDNVSSDYPILNEDCLKENLKYLAIGEGVYWANESTIESLEGDKIKLSFPPDEIVEEIQEYCDSLQIELVIYK
jgi:hypothetical protein